MAIPIAVAVAACASSSGRSGQTCALTAADSAYAIAGPVYRDCAVERRAVLLDRSEHPDFRPPSPPIGGKTCYSAEVEFVVDASGRPEAETAKVLHTTDPEFAAAAVAAMAHWRYRPATIQGAPVRQIVREKESIAQVIVMVPAGQIPRPPSSPIC